MFLYIMRHGEAEDRAASGYDFDRALSERGRHEVERVGCVLRDSRGAAAVAALPSGAEPCRVLSSPLVRARETAELVRAALGPGSPWPPVEVCPELGDGSLPCGLVRQVAARSVDAVLVGHQPVLEELVSALVNSAQGVLPLGLRPGAVVTLQYQADDHWQLSLVMNPRERGR